MIKRVLFLWLLIAGISHNAKAQVTIGMNGNSEKGAILELKEEQVTNLTTIESLENAKGGLLFSKVMLVKYDELTPLYDTATPPTDKQKLLTTGMTVYNVNPDAENIEVGLNVWDGSQWNPLSGTAGMGEVSSFDCTNVSIKGDYVKGMPLSLIGNTLTIPVTVVKKGAYTISASVVKGDASGAGNGYSFFASGEFGETGNTLITLFGQGTPLESFVDTQAEDEIHIIMNGKEVACAQGESLPTIKVEDIAPEFSFSCSSVIAATDLRIGVPATNEDVIMMRLSSNKAGARFEVQTDEINGVKFFGSGTLIGGTQIVTLYAEGTPVLGGTHAYTITSNSVSLLLHAPSMLA